MCTSYSGKHSRRKLSQISRFYGYSQKFPPQNLGTFGGTSKQPAKFLPAKNLILYQFAKVFSHKSFPLYGTAMSVGLTTGGWRMPGNEATRVLETPLTFA